MECNTAQEHENMFRAILLYPGPQSAPFTPWRETLALTYPEGSFHFRPFVIIRRVQCPLNLEELRELAGTLREEIRSKNALVFSGPLSHCTLFESWTSPCLFDTTGTYTAILAAPTLARNTGDEGHDKTHNDNCCINQGYLTNAIIRRIQNEGIQGIAMETGREVWLPSGKKKMMRRSICTRP